jgi:uncharacterized protein YegL
MPISLHAWLDHSSIRPLGTSKVSAAFEVSAHGKGVEGDRPSSRTVLALDISISMRGTPLSNVIKSVDRLLDAVGEDDEIGIVVFSGKASRLVEPIKADTAGKRLIRARVSRLTVEPSTNIEAGLEMAAAMLADARKNGPERRSGVVLLSDGEPNVGAHTPAALRDVVARHKPGISFFCLGYGKGSSEDVLSAIGDGWEFVPDPATCARAFARAVGSQADIVASDIELCLAPAPGVEILRISGREKMRITKEGLVVSLPDMVNGAKFIVAAELVVKSPGADRFAMTLVKATAKEKTSRAETDLTVEIADREPAIAVDGARRVLLVRAEEAREEARSLADKHQWAQAALVLRDVMSKITALPNWVANDGSPLAEAYELLVDEVMVYERRPDAEQYAMYRKSTMGARLHSHVPILAKDRGPASSKLVMQMAGDMPVAWLVNQMGVKYKLEEENVIGRTMDADIRVADGSVSRRHANVFANAGDFWVADMGSTNPTHVNGHALGSAPHKLTVGDVIIVGDAKLRYEEAPKKVD